MEGRTNDRHPPSTEHQVDERAIVGKFTGLTKLARERHLDLSKHGKTQFSTRRHEHLDAVRKDELTGAIARGCEFVILANGVSGREGTGYLIKGRLCRDSSFEASQLHLPTEKFGPSENDGE